MDNPFDQFDAPAQTGGSNPFDKFDSPQDNQPQEAPPDDSWGNKFSRLGTNMLNTPAGLAQLGAHATGYGTETTDAWQKQLAQKEADLKAQAGLKPEDTDWWGTAGEVLPSLAVPEVGIASKGLGLGAKTLAGITGRSAIGGAGFAAAQPVNTDNGDYWSQKATQAGTGALVGGGAGAGLSLAAKAAKPILEPAVQKLVDAGVRIPTGRMLGEAPGKVENALENYPFSGQLVRNTREQSGKDFQVQTGNKVLSRIGESVDKGIQPGPDLINHVEDKIGARYDSIHPNIGLSVDRDLETSFQNILSEAALDLPEDRVNQLSKFIQGRVSDVIDKNGGNAPGDVVQGITSKIGGKIRDYRVSTDPDQKVLGTYFGDVREAVGEAIARQNPLYAKSLQDANDAWKDFAVMRNAAGKQGTGTGQFSPTQLESAAKAGQSAGSKAKGLGPLQDWAATGKEVIPPAVGDSGTAFRNMVLGATGLAGHGVGYAALGPKAIIPGVALAALYTNTGQDIARRLITGSPQSRQIIRNLIEKYAPTVAGRIPILSNQNQ